MTRYSTTMSEILAGIRGKNLHEAPEDNMPASPDEGSMAMDQLEFIKYAADEIMQHIQGGGEFPEWMQNKLSGTHEKMKGLHANIDHDNVEDMDEAAPKISKGKAKGSISATGLRGKGMKQFDVNVAVKNGKFEFQIKDDQGRFQTVGIKQAAKMLGEEVELEEAVLAGRDYKVKDGKVHISKANFKKVSKDYKNDTKGKERMVVLDPKTQATTSMPVVFEEVELEEGKSSTGYELYHRDFSSAMQHAYDFAKKKFKITVKPEEIDNKVASGPRKPSKGKTNTYRLEGDKGAIHVQVYGMDNGKYELNMYKESVDLEEGAFGELQIVAKDLAKYAAKDKKSMDYKDFMKAAAMMKTGKVKELAKFTMDLDTEPRDKIIDMVKGAVGKSAAEKMFNVTIREEVELTEKLKVSDGLGAWIDDFKKSDAPQFKGKSDEEKKNMAIAAFTDAGGKLESVNEEEEPQKPDTAKAVDQGREDKKKTRIAQLQLQIAKAQETINKLNAQEKPSE